MGRFLIKIIILFVIIIAILTLSILTIKNHTAQESFLAALPFKNELLENKPSPRIIFVGGSNLSFGLDSKRIEDTFDVSVINMGFHAGIGLRFMLKDVEPFIRNGDIIVLIPEYADFFDNHYYGNIEAVAVLFDIYPQGLKYISLRQWRHLSLIVLKYAANNIINLPQTIKWNLYEKKKTTRRPSVYDKNSFNEYGDAYIHWSEPDRSFLPQPKCSGNEKVNLIVISEIANFKKSTNDKGAKVLILPPVFQETSYKNQEYVINLIAHELNKVELSFFSNPERYKLNDSLFFNTAYHCNKKGVDVRTALVIEDIYQYLRKNDH